MRELHGPLEQLAGVHVQALLLPEDRCHAQFTCCKLIKQCQQLLLAARVTPA